MRLMLRLFAAALLVAGCSPANYHFVHFNSRLAPFRPVPEKFDLNVLPGKTLTYFIDDESSVQLAPGDSYSSFVSEIRSAAAVWDAVDSSDLRIGFGGSVSPGASQNTPSVSILFAEVPPGLVAMGGPTVRAASNTLFVPILKSVVIVQPDLRTRPSYTEALFSTLVHEFGHALGLQHTLTSSVMATATTRSISKAHALTTDDIAGISILYPKGNFAQSTGTITGRVTMAGQAVNLASVVAVTPNGAAVSTLTNPDGTYRLEGLPPRTYYLYVHPLPPPREGQTTPADITYPLDPDGRTFPVGVPFETVFYNPSGGVRELALATLVPAAGGISIDNINFSVRQRTGYAINSVETYAFPGSVAVKPPYLSPGMVNPFVVATGSGLTGQTAGVRATVLGGADLIVRPYAPAPAAYAELDFDPRTLAFPSNSPRHLIFSANNDIYVLPSAFFHVEHQPPQILNVSPGSDGSNRLAVLLALNVAPDTQFLFDGIPGTMRLYEDLGPGTARVTLLPPSASPGQRSVIAAFNSDGQSSLFVQGDAPPSWTWIADSAALPNAIVTPATLSPGTEALVQIDATNTSFIDGQVALGLGTSDVVVRRVWVSGPGRIMVNIAVSAAALPGPLNLTIASGLQLIRQPGAFQIQGPSPRPFWIASGVTDIVSGQPSATPGSIIAVQVGVSPFPLIASNLTVLLNDTRLPVLAVAGNQVTFQIPSAFATGFATLRLEGAGERSLPTGVQIDPAPVRNSSAGGVLPQ